MRFLQFFLGTSFIFLLSCESKNKTVSEVIKEQLEEASYDTRVKNIFSFVKESQIDIGNSEYINYYVIQTKLCNACNKDELVKALKGIIKGDTSSIFILSGEDKSIEKIIGRYYKQPRIFVDSQDNLPKSNLSFLRNIIIRTHDNVIIGWNFIK